MYSWTPQLATGTTTSPETTGSDTDSSEAPQKPPWGRATTAGCRRPVLTVLPKQVLEVGLPAGRHPVPAAAPASGEGAGEDARPVGQQVALEEVGVGERVRPLYEVHAAPGRAGASREPPPKASEVALGKGARLPIHPRTSWASARGGQRRGRCFPVSAVRQTSASCCPMPETGR